MISIKLPKSEGLKTCAGTTVFTSEGVEIKNITRIQIDLQPDNVVAAVCDVAIESIDNMDNIHALLGTGTLGDIARLHGGEFIPKVALGEGRSRPPAPPPPPPPRRADGRPPESGVPKPAGPLTAQGKPVGPPNEIFKDGSNWPILASLFNQVFSPQRGQEPAGIPPKTGKS